MKQLEAVLRAHPYQWFNMYDFWKAAAMLPDREEAPPTTADGGRSASATSRTA